MTIQFQRATKRQAKLRMAITGPAGAGKTYSMLRLARGLSEKPAAVIDTENGSAAKYADQFTFDVLTLTSYRPDDYIAAIRAAEQAGYDVICVDSLTHEWKETLEEVDRRKTNVRNQLAAWQEPSKKHAELFDAILRSPAHVIATMRSKMDYQVDGGNVKALGLAPVQRDDAPYIFDVVIDLDQKHNAVVSKSRIAALADRTFSKPDETLGAQIRAWLSDGAPAPAAPAAEGVKEAAPSASTSMGIPDRRLVEKVQGLIRAALDTPEDSEERARLVNAKAFLATVGIENVTLKSIATLDPKVLADVEGLLIGADAIPV